ncbi:MAG: UDP-3-O-(3-hydroxymyristoyl)glucosamine N-acyltransferase [bacterium]
MQINLTVGEIIKLVEGQTSLDSSFLIENIKSFETAKQNDLAFFIDRGQNSVFDKFPLELIQKSNAGLILASRPIIEGKNYLIVKDPLYAFQKIVDYIQNEKFITGVHKTAIIGVTAKLEENVTICANVVIEDGTFIGKNSYIGANTYIGKKVYLGKNVKLNPGCRILHDCVIGDNTQIYSGAVIGSDGFGYEVGQLGLRKIPQIGIVRIGQNVEIGANATVDRASFDETFIGDGVKIDNMVHIAHNVYVGNHTAILAQTVIGGTVKIGFGCQIGGQVAIKDHVTIGNGAKIVSKSAVMKDIKDGETVAGIPAIPFSKWKRLMVATMRLPEIIDIAKQAKIFLDKKNEKKSFWSKLFG